MAKHLITAADGRQNFRHGVNLDDKIGKFHREIASRKASLALLDPLPFRLARRVRIPLPPPPFLPLWFNLALVFVAFDVPLTVIVLAWPLLFAATPLVYLLLFALLSTLASAGLALALALAWWQHGQRLPAWRDYGAD